MKIMWMGLIYSHESLKSIGFSLAEGKGRSIQTMKWRFSVAKREGPSGKNRKQANTEQGYRYRSLTAT